METSRFQVAKLQVHLESLKKFKLKILVSMNKEHCVGKYVNLMSQWIFAFAFCTIKNRTNAVFLKAEMLVKFLLTTES